MSESEPFLLALIPLYLILWSLWLNGCGVYLWIQGKSLIPKRFRSERVDVPRFALILTLAFLATPYLMLGSSEQPTPAEFEVELWSNAVKWTIVVNMLVLCGLMTIILLSVRDELSLVKLGFRGDNIHTQIGDGAYGFVLAFAPVYLVMAAASSMQSEETLHPLLRLLQSTGFGSEMLWVGISAVVMAPLVEELMFRVILQTWLIKHLGQVYGIALAALIFASAHGFPDSLGIFPLGVVLGIVYQQRRSYVAAVTMHAIFNAFNVAAMLIQLSQKAPSTI